MAQVQYLREDESPPTDTNWILIESSGPIWAVNSASHSDDEITSDPIGPFHTRGDAVRAATDLARVKGIEMVYVRGVA
jgi:hypothetical protein